MVGRFVLGAWLLLFAATVWGQADSGAGVEAPTDLVVVDAGTPDPEALLQGLGENHVVLRLNPGADPLEAIARTLRRVDSLSSVHLLSHGAPGALELSGGRFDQTSVAERGAALAGIGELLGEQGHLLLYGCEVAGDAAGRSFVDGLASATGVAVAASTTRVGHADLGGNWDLEYRTDAVSTGLPFTAAARADYRHVLSHGRGGIINWQLTDLSGDGERNDVVIEIKSGWRSTWGSLPINILGSLTVTPNLTLQHQGTTDFWINGTEPTDSDYYLQADIYHAYDLDPDTRYHLSYSVCCRIGGLENNANSMQGFQGTIYIGNGNEPPKIEMPIIMQVPQQDANGNTLEDWVYRVPSFDPNADTLRYRLATDAEFGGGGQVQPQGLSIHPNTGVITWSGSGSLAEGLYSAGFVAEDLDESGNVKARTHIDLILELTDERPVAYEADVPETSKIFVDKGDTHDLAFSTPAGVIDTQSLGDVQGALAALDGNEYRFDPGPEGSGLNPGIYPIVFEIRDQDGIRVHSYQIVNFVVPDPRAPRIDHLEGIRTAYSSTTPELVDPDQQAELSYTEHPSLQGGRLKFNVTFVDGEFEVLGVESHGDGAGQVRFEGGQVFHEGELIGAVHGTLDGVGRPLQINFTTEAATAAAVQAVIRNLTYQDNFSLRQVGDRAVSVFIEDQDGRSNSYDFFMEVDPHPDAPEEAGPPLEAGNALTIVEGQTVALSDGNINYADVDNRPITIEVLETVRGQFEYVSNPGTPIAEFTQQEIALGQVAFAYVDDGTRGAPQYTIQARSSSEDVAEPSSGNITFTNANLHDPQISGTPDTSVHAGVSYSFVPEATDEDLEYGDELEFRIENRPEWASFDQETGKLSGEPTLDDIGVYVDVEISVRDQGGRSDALPAFAIHVLEPLEAAVTISVTGEGASASPDSRNVAIGETASFDLTLDSGHGVVSALGCGGGMDGNRYVTGPITEACDILVNVVRVGDSGFGTEADPYVISNPEDLSSINDFPSSHFLIEGDGNGQIQVGDGWQPIGSTGQPFTGSIRGKDGPVEFVGLDGEPLFGAVADDAFVKDVYASTAEPIGIFDDEGNPLEPQNVATGEEFRFKVVGKTGTLIAGGDVLRGGSSEELGEGVSPLLLTDPADGSAVLMDDGDGYYIFKAERGGVFTLAFDDGEELTFTVDFIVRPQVAFTSTRQPGTSGQTTVVRAVLEGTPGQYPVRVPYEVSGHDLLGDSELAASGTFEFTEDGDGKRIRTFLLTPQADSSTVRIRLQEGSGPEHALLGNPVEHVVELQDAASVPLFAGLEASQGEKIVATVISRASGPVSIRARHPGTGAMFSETGYQFDWSNSSIDLGIHGDSGPTASFDPAYLNVGQRYDVRLRVRETGETSRQASVSLRLRVVDSAGDPAAEAFAAFSTETPGNLLAICPQGVEPFRGESTRTCSQVDRADGGVYLEVPESYTLSLGSMSDFASWQSGDFGLEVEIAELVDDYGQALGNSADSVYDHLGYRVDFEIHGMDFPGQSVPVVVPLPPEETIPEAAAWRKYHADGWRTFVEDDANRLYSAMRRDSGACPWPGSDRWEEGLNEGDQCVRLIIEDGGPNDFDGEADGVIRDPGSLGTTTSTTLRSGGGGGSMGPWLVLPLALLALRYRRMLLGAALLLLGTSTAGAQGVTQPGWYLGGQVGWAMTDVSSSEITDRLESEGINAEAEVDDENRLAGRVFAGYQFNRWLALEGGYTHLGEITTELDSNEEITPRQLRDARPGSGYGGELALSLGHDFNRHLRGYIRGGVFHWRSEHRIAGFDRDSRSGTDPVYGFGLEWRMTESLSARLSWDRYRVEEDDTDLVGIGVLYRFGGGREDAAATAGRTAQAPAPAESAAEPETQQRSDVAEAPRQEHEPAADTTAAVEVNATEWRVHYGLAETSAGHAAGTLDEVALALEQQPEAGLRIFGHSDSTGPAGVNMEVSEQRARAVADALIERGVDAGRLQVSGQGQGEPIATNATPVGRYLNRRTELVLATD